MVLIYLLIYFSSDAPVKEKEEVVTETPRESTGPLTKGCCMIGLPVANTYLMQQHNCKMEYYNTNEHNSNIQLFYIHTFNLNLS